MISTLFIPLLLSLGFGSPYSKRAERWSFDLTTSFYKTTENLDAEGDIVDLADGGYFQEIKNFVKVEYDWNQRLSLNSTLVVNSAKSNDGSFERSSTNVTDLYFGGDYLFSFESFQLVPTVYLKVPLQTHDQNTDAIIMNDPVMELSSSLFLVKKWRHIHLGAHLGLTYRGDDLSWLMPIGAEITYHTNSFSFNFGFTSMFTVNDDGRSQAFRNEVLERVNAGSLHYYSYEPNKTSLYGNIRYYIEPQLYLGLGINQSIFGENTSYGTTFLANLGFSFGGEKGRNLPRLRAMQFEDNTSDFKHNFMEEVDPDVDVFQQRQIRYRQQEPVDQGLKDVEMQLELKQDRPRQQQRRRPNQQKSPRQ